MMDNFSSFAPSLSQRGKMQEEDPGQCPAAEATATAATPSTVASTPTEAEPSDELVSRVSEPVKGGASASEQPLVDVKQALIKQVYRLSRDQYVEFAQQKFMMKESCRMFDTDWLEVLSKTEWYIIPTLWLPVAAVLFYHGYSLYASSNGASPLGVSAAIWVGGVFLWSLLEYVFHRFIFHFPESALPQIPAVFVIHFMIHAIHHSFPFDRLRLVLPPALFTVFFLPVLSLERQLVQAPSWLMCLILSGALVGYVMYDVSHYMFHHFPVEQVEYLKDLKRAHMDHHFKRSDLNFGVSSRLWDRVFGTLLEDDSKKQS